MQSCAAGAPWTHATKSETASVLATVVSATPSCAQRLLVYSYPICDAGCRLIVYLLLSIMRALRDGAGGVGAQHSPLVDKVRLRASSPLKAIYRKMIDYWMGMSKIFLF